jgi:dTDP-4-amino-4,6-dideoxygalactose transaminase
MSDLTAAILGTQLDAGEAITAARRAIWMSYHNGFEPLEADGHVVRPSIPLDVEHNGHTYWLLAPDEQARDNLLARLRDDGVRAQFHYVPLHSAPGGRRYGRPAGDLSHTTDIAARLVRLPLWAGMNHADVERVIQLTTRALREPRAAVARR